MLSGFSLALLINFASLVKNVLSVSLFAFYLSQQGRSWFSDRIIDEPKELCWNLATYWISVLHLISVLLNYFAVSIITGLFILQNKAVDQEQRGAAQGIAMTAMSLFKGVGPAAGGAIFSWSQSRQDAPFCLVPLLSVPKHL